MFELFDQGAAVRITGGANLPHWFQPAVTYFITFRTEDSLPAEAVRKWRAERAAWLTCQGIDPATPDWTGKLADLPEPQRRAYHERFSRQYMENLDKGMGACVLRRPELSKIVADCLLHFDGVRYHMGDFVVMPNHVHLLVCLRGETDVLGQCYSWKKFTARKLNKALSRSGRFWQEESFDHLVRSPDQFSRIQRYIRDNPRGLGAGQYILHQI